LFPSIAFGIHFNSERHSSMIGQIWQKLKSLVGYKRQPSSPAFVPMDYFSEESSLVAADTSLGVVDFGQVTICGNFREHNEDNLYTSNLDAALPLYIVADGMGGQLGGEIASQMAIDAVPRELQKRNIGEFRTTHVIKAIRESISDANQEIVAASAIQPQLSNMGTTIVLLVVRRGRAHVAGIGDSRCYRIRGNRAELLTRDHSMAQALAEVGTIRQEDVPTHRYNHVLYLYLGSREVDRGATDVKVMSLLDGDRFVLCSDGLSGVINESEMAGILKDEPNAQHAAQILVDKAVANRSRDNITCIVVNIGRLPVADSTTH
jgi:serine/threonine protein phosphatase PrpC